MIPFFGDDVPTEAIANNLCVTAELTEYGGHVGFVEGNIFNATYWAERQGARFLQATLS